MKNKPLIYIILGSTRQGRAGDKVGNWIMSEAQKRDDFDVEFIDLRDLRLPFFDEPVSPAYNKGKYSLPEAAEWAAKVGKADGFVFVLPEYNHAYPAILKNAIDYVYKEWNDKAAGMVTYSAGPWGGVRAAQQLRQVFIEVQLAPIRTSIHIPFVGTAFNEDGSPANEHLQSSAKAFFDHLVRWTTGMMAMRNE